MNECLGENTLISNLASFLVTSLTYSYSSWRKFQEILEDTVQNLAVFVQLTQVPNTNPALKKASECHPTLEALENY
jgi:hypothetical protein